MSKFHPSRQSIAENPRSLLSQVLHQFRSAFIGVGLFSALINILMLSGSMFMLQVYDRVLPSKSVPTLIGLSLIVLGLYAFQAILDLIRTRVLVRIGSAFDESISQRVLWRRHQAATQRRADGRRPSAGSRSRYYPQLPHRPGPDCPVRPALDAALSRSLLRFQFLYRPRRNGRCHHHCHADCYHRIHLARSDSRCVEVRCCPHRIRRIKPSSQRGAARSGHDGKDGRHAGEKQTRNSATLSSASPT